MLPLLGLKSLWDKSRMNCSEVVGVSFQLRKSYVSHIVVFILCRDEGEQSFLSTILKREKRHK